MRYVEPMDDIRLREEFRISPQQDISSSSAPGHSQREMNHRRRVQRSLKIVGVQHSQQNSESSYMDEGVTIPREAFDGFRLFAFRRAYRSGIDELNPLIRFVQALAESSQPIMDMEALEQWYEMDEDDRLTNRRRKGRRA